MVFHGVLAKMLILAWRGDVDFWTLSSDNQCTPFPCCREHLYRDPGYKEDPSYESGWFVGLGRRFVASCTVLGPGIKPPAQATYIQHIEKFAIPLSHPLSPLSDLLTLLDRPYPTSSLPHLPKLTRDLFENEAGVIGTVILWQRGSAAEPRAAPSEIPAEQRPQASKPRRLGNTC